MNLVIGIRKICDFRKFQSVLILGDKEKKLL
jgi:hypothetical protein